MKISNNILCILILCINFSTFANQKQSTNGLPIASLNGGPCSFNTIVEAISAAAPNDNVNIKGGIYNEILGEISKDVRLIASRAQVGGTGCEIGNGASVVIDGLGQTFDSTGGLVKITNDSRVTFINIDLTNASAINGGIMAILDNSSVLLNNSDVFNGSAVTSGGNVYISSQGKEQSQLILTNGSAIYGGTVITGNGGGVALYDSTFLITEGSIGLQGANQENMSSNNGGGIYAENSIITINNFDSSVQNNQSENNGGGIYALNSTLNITNATINDNSTAFSGGGIFSQNSNININDANINGNSTSELFEDSGGGGIYLIGAGEVIIDSTTIMSNTSIRGGGILNIGNETNLSIINGSDIINNSSQGSGGGINTQSLVLIDNSSVRFNTSNGFDGGGVFCKNCPSLSIINSSQITNNEAEISGGGVSIRTSTSIDTDVEIIDSSITSNSLTGPNVTLGGGLYQQFGTLLIENSDISSNNSIKRGGGIYLFNVGTTSNSLQIINSTITNNLIPLSGLEDGDGGAGIYLNDVLNALIIDSEFNSNNSNYDGGGIYLLNSSLKIDDSMISENIANLDGGGIYAYESDLLVENTLILQNVSFDNQNLFPGNNGGGGIRALDSNLDIINSKINQNSSNDIGGGILFEGNMNNSLSMKSNYGNIPGGCLPSNLSVDEYCSEVSNNTALYGVGLMVKGETNPQGISISGTTFSENNSDSFAPLLSDSGSTIHIGLSNSQTTNVTMENLLIVDNVGLFDEMPIIQVEENTNLEVLSTTVANNSGMALQVLEDSNTVIVQTSILQQNATGPFIANSVSFIGLCNNSQAAETGGQSFGVNLGDPQFETTTRGDYRLSISSPSVDACTFGSGLDADGNTRPNNNSNYDQGAFERGAELFLDLIFNDGFEQALK